MREKNACLPSCAVTVSLGEGTARDSCFAMVRAGGLSALLLLAAARRERGTKNENEREKERDNETETSFGNTAKGKKRKKKCELRIS